MRWRVANRQTDRLMALGSPRVHTREQTGERPAVKQQIKGCRYRKLARRGEGCMFRSAKDGSACDAGSRRSGRRGFPVGGRRRGRSCGKRPTASILLGSTPPEGRTEGSSLPRPCRKEENKEENSGLSWSLGKGGCSNKLNQGGARTPRNPSDLLTGSESRGLDFPHPKGRGDMTCKVSATRPESKVSAYRIPRALRGSIEHN